MKWIKWVLVLWFALAAGLVQAEAMYQKYPVKSGDTLSAIAWKHELNLAGFWRANCDVVKNPHLIYPGMQLVLAAKAPHEKACGMKTVEPRVPSVILVPTAQTSVEASVKPLPAVKKSVQASRPAPAPKTQVSGPRPVDALNVAPYRPSRSPKVDRKVLKSIPNPLTDSEIDEFQALEQSGKCELQPFYAGTEMFWMVGARGKVTTSPYGLVGNWKGFHSARVCELSNGRRIAIFQICENLAELPPAPAAPVIAQPEAVVVPPNPVGSTDVPAPTEGPKKEAESDIFSPAQVTQLCRAYRDHTVAGFEMDWNKQGGGSKAFYAQVAKLCTVHENYQGSYSIGAIVNGSMWDGSTGKGGDFKGFLLAGGLAQEYVAIQEKYDWLLGFPMVGVFHDEFRQGSYDNARRFNPVLALTANLNAYPRKARGEDSWYETQVSTVVAHTLGSSLIERWEGREFGDGSALKMPWYINLTVRQYAYRNYLSDEWGNVEWYLQLGGLKADRLSGNARVGMAAMRRCVGFGAGVNFSADGVNPALGGWTDPLQCGVFYRNWERGKFVTELAAARGIVLEQSALIPISEDEAKADPVAPAVQPESGSAE